ncbi:MAG: acyl-CoA thioesterase [Acidimicrobiales bacterium]
MAEAGEVSDDREKLLAQLVDALRPTPLATDRLSVPTPDWWGPRLFGGAVVAQALAGAMGTVEAGLRPHSMHGYFFRPVVPGPDAELVVERVRDSRTFATREVTTVQNGKPAARFTCSFTGDETGEDHAEHYEPPMPAVPEPEQLFVGRPPGPFDSADAGPLVADDGSYRSSGRYWNRTCGPLPDDAAIHFALLALMSDMTRTSFRPPSLATWASHTDASIDHAVWFHRPARADEWLFYDLAAVINLDNRALVRGVMYNRDGKVVLSMAQELLIRPIPGGGEPAPWLAEKF